MLSDPISALTGAVDAAVAQLRTLNVPEAEIAQIRTALLDAGQGLDPSLVQPVAPGNFGSRGDSLAHHTRLAHERLVSAIATMAESFDLQSTSLDQFKADMQTREEETAADLVALRAAAEQIAQPPYPGGQGTGNR